MKKVKMIKVTGSFDVCGIVNFNGTEKLNGYNNHKACKKLADGIDYTSSNCVRQAMFNDLVPRQPGSEFIKKDFPRLMGTLVGLLRGGLDAGSGCKSKSPITLLDAISDGKHVVFEQNSSTNTSTNTSIFSSDNAGPRKQKLEAILRIADLQMKEVGDSDSVVSKKDSDIYINSLKNTFESLDSDLDIEIKSIIRKGQASPIPRDGIVFSTKQQQALVLKFIELLSGIEVFRRNASFIVDLKSLMITVTYSDMSSEQVSLDSFVKSIPNMEFQQFWIEA